MSSTSDIGLTITELADIRSDINQLLPETCTIQYVTETSDSIGYPARSYTNRGTAISCRLDPVANVGLMGHEAISAMRNYLITENMWMLTLKHDQTIASTDHVIIGSTTYEVRFVDGAKSWKGSTRAVLEVIST